MAMKPITPARSILILVTGIFLYIVFIVPYFLPSGDAPLASRVVSIGDVLLDVRIADTAASRERGLSGKDTLNENEGMLFVFSKTSKDGFWMKDMRFPIDILWFDENGELVGKKEEATPESFPEVFYPESPARYVLETHAGFIAGYEAEYGIAPHLDLR